MDIDKIKAVVFDADDTLWSNEPFFRGAEKACYEVLSGFGPEEHIAKELFRTEMDNMLELGYGAKSFIISMIETAIRVSSGKVSAGQILQIEQAGRKIMRNPATPYPGVAETLDALEKSGRYALAVLTKGELLDQHNKMDRSGLGKFFSFVEVVNEKTEEVYREMCDRLFVTPGEMLMVGNSFRSDIDPVLKMGGNGIYIPSVMTWQHEVIEEYEHPCLIKVSRFQDLAGILLPD